MSDCKWCQHNVGIATSLTEACDTINKTNELLRTRVKELEKRLAVQGCELGSSEAYAEEVLLPKIKELTESVSQLEANWAEQRRKTHYHHNKAEMYWEENARLREALELVAAPKRADGTYNRSREACEELASAALKSQAGEST